MTGERNSDPQQLAAAAATLARSRSAWTVVRWVLLVVVLPALGSAAGWITAKLDTSDEIRELRLSVNALAEQQGRLVTRIDDLVREPDGVVPKIRLELRGVRREHVVSTAAAMAYEPRRKQKLEAGEQLGKVFDRQIDQGVHPAAAAYSVLTNVAVP